MFGYGHDLLKLIPRISWLAYRRLHCKDPLNGNITREFDSVKAEICEWQLPSSVLESDGYSLAIAALMFQQAFLIFLYSAAHGPGPANALLLLLVEPHIAKYFELMDRLPLDCSVWTGLLWTVMISGFCMRDTDRQEHLALTISRISHSIYACSMALVVLRWVWEDSDKGVAEMHTMCRPLVVRNSSCVLEAHQWHRGDEAQHFANRHRHTVSNVRAKYPILLGFAYLKLAQGQKQSKECDMQQNWAVHGTARLFTINSRLYLFTT